MKKSFFFIAPILLIIVFISAQKIKPQSGDNSDCKDITNAILTRNSPYSQNYVGKYCATVKDMSIGISFEANFSIEHAGDKTIWHTDAIPNHNFNDKDPFSNTVSEQNYTFQMPDKPSFASALTPLSLDYYNAILLNGAVVDLLSDGCCGVRDGIIGCSDTSNPWRKDPMFPSGEFKPDSHNAHSQSDGTYHYHGPPNALYDLSGKKESPVIGFAADGFPIYGPYINDHGTIRKVKSSYRLKAGKRSPGCPGITDFNGVYIQDYMYDPVGTGGDLDECNGMTRNGHYGYYVTDAYPYIIKFFKGKPDASFKKHDVIGSKRPKGIATSNSTLSQ